MSSESDCVSIYVENNDDENDRGKEVFVNQDRDENIGADLDEEKYFPGEDEFDNENDNDYLFNSNDDDPEFIDVKENKKDKQRGNCYCVRDCES